MEKKVYTIAVQYDNQNNVVGLSKVANVNQATSIKVDNFNTSKVTNMEKMFDDTKKRCQEARCEKCLNPCSNGICSRSSL